MLALVSDWMMFLRLYKRFAAIYKEVYEMLSRPGWLGMEGDPPMA